MNKQTMDVLMSSGDTTGSSEWATPDSLMRQLVKRFRRFTLDPAASRESAKAATYYTERDDGLSLKWAAANVFVNPPYGRGLKKWVAKAVEEITAGRAKQIVMLLPARTDTKWFHEYVLPYARDVFFIKGRVTFEVKGSKGNPAPFPSMIVRFDRDPKWWGCCRFEAWT